ncbi:MAG: methyltransferase domain-containing protein [Candidatus Aureabacteria bacterium]|nr:methyltransferase domain-containing protein [Candidatus Auribacterota bacterium]
MGSENVFDEYFEKYDAWYDRNRFVYLSELKAIKKVLPKKGKGLEIGVGTGRFASKLGVSCGIDSSAKMIALAKMRGVPARIAAAEKLPFGKNFFDYALMVVTLSFVKNPQAAIRECARVLKDNGKLIIAIIDKNSFLGRFYRRKKGIFYKHARLLSPEETVSLMKKSGFRKFVFYQTIFRPLDEIKRLEPVKKGYGEGGFVVIRAGRL